jgi:hypothetical protein
MIDIQAHIKALVAAAPPPSPEQINRLRLIFWGTPLRTFTVEPSTFTGGADVAA